MNIKVCKTGGVTEKEWSGFVGGFNETFDRQSTVEDKKTFYSSNLSGYSYHAFAVSDEGKIVGHTSLIPACYMAGREKVMLGISGGTFVSEEYRKSIFLFKKMYVKLKEFAKRDGMAATLGVPNENSFQYAVKILKKIHIGDLNYYVMPVRPGNMFDVPGKSLLNVLAGVGVFAWFWLCRFYALFHNPREPEAIYEGVKSDDFLENRFRQGYKKINNRDCRCYYKLENEKGVEVAYIMHAANNASMDLKTLLNVCGSIMKKEKVDLIMYIGLLNLFPRFLFKVPASKTPKRLPLTIDVMDENLLQDGIYNIRNWKFGLIDFDVR